MIHQDFSAHYHHDLTDGDGLDAVTIAGPVPSTEYLALIEVWQQRGLEYVDGAIAREVADVDHCFVTVSGQKAWRRHLGLEGWHRD